MTDIELQEYNQLTTCQKEAYNMGMKYHPDWSHAQAITYANIICINPFPPENNGGGTGTTPKDIFAVMIEKAEEFIKRDFPRIYIQVKQYFVEILKKIKNAVVTTWNQIIEFFSNL